jgi:hypothetical protein
MKDLFKFIESDEPTLTDDYLQLIADEDISISLGDGVYMLNHWLPEKEAFQTTIYDNLQTAMRAACQTYAFKELNQ